MRRGEVEACVQCAPQMLRLADRVAELEELLRLQEAGVLPSGDSLSMAKLIHERGGD